jgi:PKD repeat protein
MRENYSPLMRITAAVILIITMLILEPKGVAAQHEGQAAQLDKIVETTLSEWQENLASNSLQHSALESNQTANLKQEVLRLDEHIEADFEAIAEQIRHQNLSPEIMQRHIETVARYRQERDTLLNNLDAIDAATDNEQRRRSIDKALNHLKPLRKGKHAPFDPNHLPFNTPKGNVRPPIEDEKELKRRFPATKKVKVATTTLLPSMLKVAQAPDSTDLDPTEDVQITPEIEALALELEHNPVKIYNWVHDNIQFIPTYGSIRGSQMTLDSKSGNAFDTASLLIALLRASGIHARYAYGTVRIPINQAMNWVGVTSPEAAMELFGQGGIPTAGLAQGGSIKFLKLEHIWVSAWIDFFPSRGARHKTGDSWVPMDASFKQHTFTPAINLAEQVPFDIEALRDHILTTAQIDEQGGMTEIDLTYMQDSLNAYETELETYVKTNNIEPEELLGSKAIIPANRSVLAASLPYTLIAIGSQFNEIPSHLTHRLTVKFYHSLLAQTLDDPTLSYTLSLPALNTQRLSVTYLPATEADAEALEEMMNSGLEKLPLYLFQVKPVLKLENTVLVEGSAIQMGQAQYYTTTFTDPHQIYTEKGQATAGDEIALVVNGNGISIDIVQKRSDTVAFGSTAAENLHQTGLRFWMEHDLFDSLAAQTYNVRVQRMPSIGTFLVPLTVEYAFGIPRAGYYKLRQVDVKRNVQTLMAPSDEIRFKFLSHIGMHGSYLEGSVLDQVFGRSNTPARSTSQILLEATEQNIPIYKIDQDNLNEILPLLSVSAEVKDDIRTAISAGLGAIVPQTEIVVGNWIGTGYILQDLITGAGAYLIEGGLNGGSHEGCVIDQKRLIRNQPVLKVRKDWLFRNFARDQAYWKAKLDQAKNLNNQLYVGYYSELLDQSARAFVAALIRWDIEFVLEGEGCFVAKAKKAGTDGYTKEEFYVRAERDAETGDFTIPSVEFIGEGLTPCWAYEWDFGDETGTSTQTDPNYSYSEIDKYTVSVAASCDKIPGRVTSEIEVYVSLVEMDVREALYGKVNRITADDIRRTGDDETAINKLLVWDDGTGSIQFEAVKLDEKSVFWVEVVGIGQSLTLNPQLPIFEKLTNTQETKSFTLKIWQDSHNFNKDFVVKYGFDNDKSGSLAEDEIEGEYEIYGLTPLEYSIARANFNGLYLPLALYKLANALNYRFSNGVFPDPDIFGDYWPNGTGDDVYDKAGKRAYDLLTHQCGATLNKIPGGVVLYNEFDEKGNQIYPNAIPGRLYPDAKVTLKRHYYDPMSDAAYDISDSPVFIEGLKAVLKTEFPYEDLDNLYATGTIPADCVQDCENLREIQIHYSDETAIKIVGIDFGPFGNLGLGNVAPIPVSDVALYVQKRTEPVNFFEIIAASVTAKITDNFDYNYFKRSSTWWKDILFKVAESSISAATIQCGFGKLGQFNEGTGQVGTVEIDTEVGFHLISFIEPILVRP